MATEKYLKVIIDGETNYIPDNKGNRQFWAKQNSRIGNGRNSSQYIATITTATDEEVAHMTLPEVQSQVLQATNTNSEIESLRNLVLQQQELVNKLLAEKLSSGIKDPDPLAGLDLAGKSDPNEPGKEEKLLTKKSPDGKNSETQAKA